MTDNPPASVSTLLVEIAHIGVDGKRGGYSRPVFSRAELDLRSWFVALATKRGLDVEMDRNGIIWAWSGGVGPGAVVTGSHLDSVPGGGAYDGPLGIASALAAFDHLVARGVGGRRAIAVLPEEEGSRFGLACLGSRLMTGALTPDRVRSLKDTDGTSFADAAQASGLDPTHMGADPDTLDRIGTFVELHVEQGRGLVDLDRPIAVASSILAHGRWRITVTGEGNHAGTTVMDDRHDPMVAAAQVVLAIQSAARKSPQARATVVRLSPTPGGTNVIASRVDLWLDVRHPEDSVVHELVEEIRRAASRLAADEGCSAALVEESYSPSVDFDARLREDLAGVLSDAPVLGTGPGHDAGVLKEHVRTAMLFVRNPSGVSHAPGEHVETDDAEAGAIALADRLQFLSRSSRRRDPRQDLVEGSRDRGERSHRVKVARELLVQTACSRVRCSQRGEVGAPCIQIRREASERRSDVLTSAGFGDPVSGQPVGDRPQIAEVGSDRPRGHRDGLVGELVVDRHGSAESVVQRRRRRCRRVHRGDARPGLHGWQRDAASHVRRRCDRS